VYRRSVGIGADTTAIRRRSRSDVRSGAAAQRFADGRPVRPIAFAIFECGRLIVIVQVTEGSRLARRFVAAFGPSFDSFT
jgi:hypothetical protein